MSVFHTILSALLLSCLAVTLPHPAQAQTPTQPVPTASISNTTERLFTLDYKDGLLSLREEGGMYLFAQAATTPLVQVHLEAGRGKGLHMILQDEKGKQLWASPIAIPDSPPNSHGSFAFKTSGKGGIQFAISRADAPAKPVDKDTPEKLVDKDASDKLSLVAQLRADNTFLSGDFKSGKDGGHLQRLENGKGITFTTYKDGKIDSTNTISFDEENNQVSATVNGEKVGSVTKDDKDPGNNTLTLSDTSGKVVVRNVKQDGKEFVEVQLGDRRLLIEGANFNAELKEGVLVMSVTPVSPAPAVGSKP